MLEERLKSASREASQHRIQSSIKVMALAAVTGAVMVGVTLAWQSGTRSEETSSAVPSTHSNQSLQQRKFNREDFKDALQTFETTLEPLISSESFVKWNSDAHHEALSGKDKAIRQFSAGEYDLAMAELSGASNLAETELAAMDDAFSAALKNAQTEYERDAYDKAAIEITKALKIRPGDDQALMLYATIQSLPRVLELLKDVAKARTENNLDAEATALRLIVTLAPDRQDVIDRLSVVERVISEQKFSALITSGLKYVSKRNLNAAQQSLASAKKLHPDRSEIALLSGEVEKLSRSIRMQSLLGQASTAANSDDWAQALELYAQAGRIEPNHQSVIEGTATAQTILSLQSKITVHLKNKHRLGTDAARRDVRTILKQSTPLHPLSPSLSQQSTALLDVLEAYGRGVPVLVRSDNQTNILVRGVGKIGQTTERYIELKPGSYTLEGVRPGYKSKLVKVSIEPKATDVVVEIVCNERL